MKLSNFIKLFIIISILILLVLLIIFKIPWKKIIRYGERNLVSGNRSIIYKQIIYL